MSTAQHISLATYAQAVTLTALERVRSLALEKALRYRFDPTLSRVHQEYLEQITNLMGEYNA